MNGLTSIGAPLTRVDGPAKARGLEKYAADHYPPGLLWAGVKRSDHAHAMIKKIDIFSAGTVPGVAAVLTSKNIKGSNRVGLPEMDQPILADDKVRFRGDPVALVLAEDKSALALALEQISVEYQVLNAVFDPEQAMEQDAPVLHENRGADKGKNILISGTLKRGNITEALEQCDALVEGEFHLPRQEHAYLETEAGVARLTGDNILEITVSTQTPYRDRTELAHALGLPADKIRVIAPYLGGGFGGKDGITVQGLLGLAALHSGGRPVKMWTTREESFICSPKRHPARIRYRLGCKNGTLHAMTCRIIMDTGAYASLGGPVLAMAMEHAAGVYRIPHVLVEGYSVYTNNPVSGAFRGFGACQVLAGLEQTVDMLAVKGGLDALEFRLKNAVNRGDTTGCGVHMSNSTGIIPCLKTVQQHPFWVNRDKWVSEAPAFKRRGVGIAAGMQGTGYGPVVPDIANAKIKLLPEGRFRIYSGVSDMGQGNNSTNVHIAGEVLCQEPDAFELLQPDTFRTLPSGSSSASRTTFTFGNALKEACILLKERILARACNLALGVYKEDLLLIPGKVLHLPTGREIPLALIASAMAEDERVCVSTWTAPVARYPDSVNPEIRAAGFPHRVFSFACHLVRLEIDELTGEIAVCDYLACTDGGRVLNPQAYEQQIQGGVVQGMGYALWEDFKVAEGGETLTRNLATYILPTAADVPNIISLPVETEEETGPFGMKGIGEIVINLPFPAIANAVAMGLGRRIFQGPLNLEHLQEALQGSEKEAPQ